MVESMVGVHEPTFLTTDVLKTLGSTGLIILVVGVFLLAILVVCTIALIVWYCRKSSLEKSTDSARKSRAATTSYAGSSRPGTLSTHPRFNPSAPTLSPRSEASTGVVRDEDDDIIVVTSSDDHSGLYGEGRDLQLDPMTTSTSPPSSPSSDIQNRATIYL